MLLIAAPPDIITGLAETFGGIAGTALAAAAMAVGRHWWKRRKDIAKALAAPSEPPAPTAPQPTNPFGHAPPPTDPYLLRRLDALESQADRRQEWVEQDLRRALAEASTDLAQKTRALLVERERRKTAEVRLAAKEQQLSTLEDALTRVTRERDQAELELAAARAREVAAAAAIPPMGEDDKRTPLRPPAPGPRRAP